MAQALKQILCLPRYRSSARVEHASRGSVLVEAAIIIPFLLFLAFAVLDIGKLFHTYLALSDVTNQGIRYAGALPGLETQAAAPGEENYEFTNLWLPENEGVCASNFSELCPVHTLVHRRAFQLLQIANLTDGDSLTLEDNPVVASTAFPGNPSAVTEDEDTVCLSITTTYRSILGNLGILNNFELSYQATGRYLFETWTSGGLNEG